MQRKYFIASLSFLLILAIPLLFWVLGIASKPLGGVEKAVEEVELTWESWWNGAYQRSVSAQLDRNNPVRPDLIRLRGQFMYTVLHKNTSFVIKGLDGQLFSYEYIDAFNGYTMKPPTHFNAIADSLVQIRHHLDSLGIPMLVYVAPNKARILSESIPESFVRKPDNPTPLSEFTRATQSAGLEITDLNQLLLNAKAAGEPSAFCNTGIHWNYNGIATVLPTFDTQISAALNLPPQGLHLNGGEWSNEPYLKADVDLSEKLNMIAVPDIQPQYVPNVEVSAAWEEKPKILWISDSYAWGLVGSKSLFLFSDSWEFWFYNNSVITTSGSKSPIDRSLTPERIKEFDLVIFMGTESNLRRMPYGFLRDLQQ